MNYITTRNWSSSDRWLPCKPGNYCLIWVLYHSGSSEFFIAIGKLLRFCISGGNDKNVWMLYNLTLLILQILQCYLSISLEYLIPLPPVRWNIVAVVALCQQNHHRCIPDIITSPLILILMNSSCVPKVNTPLNIQYKWPVSYR